MKKSEFKALVKEAMMEILPDLMQIMAENLVSESYTPQSTQQKPDLSLIRQQFSQGISGDSGYVDMPDAPRRSKATPIKTESTIIDGEKYTSGQGIMEWFGKTAQAKPLTEFKHSSNQMDDFVSKKFGV